MPKGSKFRIVLSYFKQVKEHTNVQKGIIVFMENTNRRERRKESHFQEVWRRFKKNKTAVVGLVIITIMILLSAFAPLIVPYEKGIELNAADRLTPPSLEYPFGTDNNGRDMFSRVLHGGRISLTIGFVVMGIVIAFGSIIGAFIAYHGGIVDFIAMRICDVIACIPSTLLTLALVAVLGTGTYSLFVAITIATIPAAARYVRSLVLTVAEQEYIEAAKSYGAKSFRLITQYMLPNVMGPLIVNTTMNIGGVILLAASLSYIGMGIQPPTPEWGSMLSNAQGFINRAPYLLYFPGFAIMLAALSLNLVGDGLRDALDPRMKN